MPEAWPDRADRRHLGLPRVPVSTESSTRSSVLGGLAQVGKYFQLISIVPAAVVVVTIFALVAGGAPTRRPTWDAIGERAAGIDLATASALALAILTLGMLLHPLQFAFTRLLEGYWGHSYLGRFAMFSKASIHLERRRRWLREMRLADRATTTADNRLRDPHGLTLEEFVGAERSRLAGALNYEAFSTAAGRYPETHRLRPTRLGNTLRLYEDIAGRPYGLDALAVVPHLMWLAPADHIANVDDARSDLDLAVRFVCSWLLLAVSSFVLLWPYGVWLLVPLTAYGLAWVSYAAAVQSADEYGGALLVLVDLNHRLLAEQFPLPPDRSITFSARERARAISDTARRNR